MSTNRRGNNHEHAAVDDRSVLLVKAHNTQIGRGWLCGPRASEIWQVDFIRPLLTLQQKLRGVGQLTRLKHKWRVHKERVDTWMAAAALHLRARA
jgi:hypothetical protein